MLKPHGGASDSLYGTVKINEPNHALSPIISQIHTVIYEYRETIKQRITPYLPGKYNIKSKDELSQVPHTINLNTGISASLDVKYLFTNVPLSENH